MIYNQLSFDQKIQEIASIAVVLGDHFTNLLYEDYQKQSMGYVCTVEKIGEFAIEFFDSNLNTDWSEGVLIWDDEVYSFGQKRVAEHIEKGI